MTELTRISISLESALLALQRRGRFGPGQRHGNGATDGQGGDDRR